MSEHWVVTRWNGRDRLGSTDHGLYNDCVFDTFEDAHQVALALTDHSRWEWRAEKVTCDD